MNALTSGSLRVMRGTRAILDIEGVALPSGAVTMILGPNGAGKTTLLRALMGFEGQRDSIKVNGKSLTRMTRLELAKLVQWVPGRISLPFPFLVRDVLLLGRFPHHQGFSTRLDYDECHATAITCHIEPLMDRVYSSLSSGEQARVQIARALAARPQILLLDEPCASLDIAATLEILGHLATIARSGTTVVLSHHDLHTVHAFATHVLFLKSGTLHSAGTVLETFTAVNICAVFGISLESIRSLSVKL